MSLSSENKLLIVGGLGLTVGIVFIYNKIFGAAGRFLDDGLDFVGDELGDAKKFVSAGFQDLGDSVGQIDDVALAAASRARAEAVDALKTINSSRRTANRLVAKKLNKVTSVGKGLKKLIPKIPKLPKLKRPWRR